MSAGRGAMGAGVSLLLGLLLAGCGQDPAATSSPPQPVDTSPRKPPVADVQAPVASGNTPAAADIAAIAALGAAFDPARDAAADLATAQVEAKRGNRRIVLELGDAACAECAALDGKIEGDGDLRRARDAGFIWVKVDRSATANAALLAGLPGGMDAPAPHLLVLDADGQVLHAQPGTDLLRNGQANARRIRGFLEQWAPPATPPAP